MGLGGISIWQLLIVLLIVALIFGTSRLRSLGGDIGSALKSFRKAVDEPERPSEKLDDKSSAESEVSSERNRTRDI